MIDRKTLWISVPILLALIASALWQLSTVHDWQHTPSGSGLALFAVWFAAPVSLLIMMAVAFLTKWLEPKETQQASRRWIEKRIVGWSLFFALMQAFVLAASLGHVSLSLMPRVALALAGILLMVTCNTLPKAPSSASLGNRYLRFLGKLLVGVGLVLLLSGILLPLEWWKPVVNCLMLGALAGVLWAGFIVGRDHHLPS
jgi:hypothetical protein